MITFDWPWPFYRKVKFVYIDSYRQSFRNLVWNQKAQAFDIWYIVLLYGFTKLIKAKFHTKLLWDTETKGFSNCTGYHIHMFHSLKMLPQACSEQIVSDEL